MVSSTSSLVQDSPDDDPTSALPPGMLRRIESALRRVGQYGEVRLLVQKGRIRFIEVVQSEEIRPDSHA